jgi:hypothetical protein
MYRFLNCVYAWCLEQVGPNGRERFEEDLAAPLPGMEKSKPSPFQVEEEGEAFMAMMALAQQAKGVTGGAG